MKKNKLSELSNKELIKKRDLLKGIVLGFGIVILFTIGMTIYILMTKELSKTSMPLFISVFSLPVIFVASLISFSLLNKEINSRNLK